MNEKLKSPYPYFGGKSKVSDIIWQGLGKVNNYVEPFAGSLAVLLLNPNIPKVETVNDIDVYLTNFWRAITHEPEKVAQLATIPVNEIEVHARHKYLLSLTDLKDKMENDLFFYDVEAAAAWIYGISASVGNNWMQNKGLKALPLLSSGGGGIHGFTADPLNHFKLLQERMKRVRVTCGDWKRILTPGITFNQKGISKNDFTGVFLDPPYDQVKRERIYKDDNKIFHEVMNWAIDNGNQPNLRIVLCGYDNDYVFPEGWQTYHWQANGGMANIGEAQGRENAKKETIWFSPQCLKVE